MAVLSDPSTAAQELSAASKRFDLTGRSVFVAGHRGMVGSAIVRRLARVDCEVITVDRERLDLRQQDNTAHYLGSTKPDVVIVAAAQGRRHPCEQRLSGSISSTKTCDCRERNRRGVSCRRRQAAVPWLILHLSAARAAADPEEALLTGPLEPTNEWYAIAKIAGIKLCQAYRRQYGADFISVMPTNLYGPGDNYHPENSHVVAALIRRFHEAKSIALAIGHGLGHRKRRAANSSSSTISPTPAFTLRAIFGGIAPQRRDRRGCHIADLARAVAEVVGYRGELVFDTSRPDGAPQKLLNVSKLNALGWKAGTPLPIGLERSYADFLERGSARRVCEGIA